MEKNKFLINKVYLKGLLEVLTIIYLGGTEFVNIMVEKGEHQDNIYIIEEEPAPENETGELSEEELNKLI